MPLRLTTSACFAFILVAFIPAIRKDHGNALPVVGCSIQPPTSKPLVIPLTSPTTQTEAVAAFSIQFFCIILDFKCLFF